MYANRFILRPAQQDIDSQAFQYPKFEADHLNRRRLIAPCAILLELDVCVKSGCTPRRFPAPTTFSRSNPFSASSSFWSLFFDTLLELETRASVPAVDLPGKGLSLTPTFVPS